MAKFKFYVNTGYLKSERKEVVEIDDEDLEGTPEEREKVINGYYDEWLWENINTHWEEVEE